MAVTTLKRDARMYLSRALNRSLAPPDWVSINLTMTCNLKCTMCTTCYDAPNELTVREVKSIIDQAAIMGVEILNPLGGEPFVRRDLEEILAYAAAQDFYTTVTTNGTLITGARAKKIAQIPDSKLHFNISLDGIEDVNDDIRGKGNFAKAISGYERIRAADAEAGNSVRKIMANTLIHNKNLDTLEELLDDLASRGFDGVQLLNLFRNDGSAHDLTIPEERMDELHALVERLVTRVESQGQGFVILNSIKDLRLIPTHARGELLPLEAPCWAGFKELYIHSDGSAIMCDGNLEFLEGKFGDVRKQTLAQIWRSDELKRRRQVVKECSTPCVQNCYLRRSSDSGVELGARGGRHALESLKAQVARLRTTKQERIDGKLTLELSDSAPWEGEDNRAARRHYDSLVSNSPVSMAEVWEDPFRWYELRDRGYVDFGRGFLGREVIRRVLSDMAATGLSFDTVELSWRGEPLLHPEIVLILQDVLEAMVERETFRELRIVTDGRLLNTQIADVVSSYDVNQTWILHGNGVGECEAEVIRNFDYFLSVRHNKIAVVASWLVDEMIDPFAFVQGWSERLNSPAIVIGKAPASGDAIWFRRSDHNHFIGTKEANERLVELAEILEAQFEVPEEKASTKCYGPEKSPTISWDGKVTMCRWDRELKNRVGSVTDGKLSQIWSTGVDIHRRDAKGKGRPSNDLCRDCHYIHSPNV